MNFKKISNYFHTYGVQTAFLLLTLFLLGSAWISIENISRVIEREQQVVDSHQIIGQIQKVGLLIVDLETGYRGFTLSGQSKYLEPLEKAKAALPREMERLKTLITTDPFQQQKIQTLDDLIQEKLKVSQTILRTRQKSNSVSAGLLADMGRGKVVMDRIRGVLGEMTAGEEADLQERQAEAQTSARQTVWFFVLTLVLSLFFMGLGFLLQERNRKNRLELVNYSEKLKASNQDLQDFIFIVAHDLQAPLRNMHSFGSLLKAEMGPVLTPDAADYLLRIQNSAKHMNMLITDLLRLAGVTSQAKPFEPVDLSVIVQEVRSSLESSLKQCGGRIEIGPLPRLEADASQMRQLFQNLLDNALKYHKEDTAPLVRVESETDLKTGMTRIWVRDNGIGFEQQYAKKIFTIFHRLHADDQFEGTGVGLSICRKVVERHQGVITAQSWLGEGATFEIVLPLNPKQ